MTGRSDGAPRGPVSAPRGRTVRERDPINAGLRRMWADAEQEPLPDDLLALIQRIDGPARDGGPERGR